MAIDNPKVNIMAILVEFLKTILTTNKWKASGEKLSMSIQTFSSALCVGRVT